MANPLNDISSTFSSVGDFVKNTLSSLNFINPFGSQAPQLRYPLGDIQKHQNVVKFEAIARVKRSSVLDFRVAKFAESALGSVTLYMPSGISVADTLSYDNADTGIGGEIMKAGGSSASPGEFIDTLKGQSKGVAQTAVAGATAKVSQSKGMVGGAANQAIINRGEVVNPHTQMLFKSPSLRQFQFQFKMFPRTKAEAQQIIKIVQFFRVAAYPQLGTGSGSDQVNMSTFKFPDVFKVTYLTGGKENRHMIKMMESYLTAVTVNYNSTSPTFYEDGMPSEIDLSLTFQESKALNRDLILSGGY
jgi:hypothetical protein